MATITTRSGKGSALTHIELDANFTNLNTDKLEASDLVGYLTQSTADTLYEPLIDEANRITFYRQSTQPSGGTYREGDLWYKTDDEDMYFYREVSSGVYNWVLFSTATDNSDTLDGGSY